MTSNVPRPADFRGVLRDGRMSVVLREVLGYSVYTLLLGRSAVYPPATKLTKLTDADGRTGARALFCITRGRRPSGGRAEGHGVLPRRQTPLSQSLANSCSSGGGRRRRSRGRLTDSSKDLLAKKSEISSVYPLSLARSPLLQSKSRRPSPSPMHSSLRMTSPNRVVQTHTHTRSP